MRRFLTSLAIGVSSLHTMTDASKVGASLARARYHAVTDASDGTSAYTFPIPEFVLRDDAEQS